MEINYLKELVVLVNAGSYSEAAEQLFISQPSLTKHIQRIELELGADIFEKSRKKLILTDFGKRFINYAIKISELQAEYSYKLLSVYRQNPQKISIGIVKFSESDNRIFSKAFEKFTEKFPSCVLNTTEQLPPKLSSRLRQDKIDFAITKNIDGITLREPQDDFRTNVIMQKKLIAILPVSHPLSKNKAIDLKQLADDYIIELSLGTHAYYRSTSACDKDSFVPKIITTFSPETKFQMVKSGHGVAITLEDEIPQDMDKLTVVQFDPPILENTNVLCLKKHTLNFYAQQLINFFINEIKASQSK